MMLQEHAGDARYWDTRFIDIIRGFGLDENLELCLDAADGQSYSSGQVWLDVSGNGVNFNRGATSGAEASDPTFNGVANGQSSSEFWSFDGGDYFRCASANPTFVNNMHKNNAAFTIASWVRLGDITDSNNPICGTNAASGSAAGIYFGWQTLEQVALAVTNGSTIISNHVKAGTAVALNTWVMFSVTMDEAVGANGCAIGINDDFSFFTSTYSSPSASNASNTMDIGSFGNGVGPMFAGARMGSVAMWSRPLSVAELTLFFERTRGRYGV
jgi:hypothetical protein